MGFLAFVSLYLKWIEEYRERIERLKKTDEKPLKMNASLFFFLLFFLVGHGGRRMVFIRDGVRKVCVM